MKNNMQFVDILEVMKENFVIIYEFETFSCKVWRVGSTFYSASKNKQISFYKRGYLWFINKKLGLPAVCNDNELEKIIECALL